MDFSNDILMTDPFLTLDTDLEDVSAVIRNNMSDQPGILDSSPTPSPEYRHDNDFRADFKLSPPDPSKEREIGQIVSLLQDDMNINYNSRYMEPYGFNEGFNHFDSTQQNSLANGYHHVSAPNLVRVQQQFQQLPTQVVTQPGPQGYQQPGGYQRLSSTPQQYVSPGVDQQLYVTTNFYDPHQQIVPSTSYVSPAPASGMNSIQFQVQNGSTINTTSPTTQNYPLDGELKVGHPLDGDQNTLSPTTNTPTSPNVNSTKKELIRMLLEMTPSEFENLRAGKGRESLLRSKARNSDTALSSLSSRAKPSGVATKMTKLGPISPVSAIDPMDTGIAPLSVSRQFSSPLVSPTLLSAHSVDWRDDESDTETDFQPPSRKAPKTERRTAHNLIEKKYRCSINDRIVLLKEMLAPEEVKLSKSATLRKAIDEINNLRALNAQLVQENETLRAALRAAGIETVDLSRVKHEPQNGHHLRIRDGSTSPHSSTSSNASTTSNNSRSKKPRQMLNQSRVTLCVFMCVMVAFNPVAFFLSSGSAGQANAQAMAHQPDHPISINEHHQHTAHRTLMANSDPFDTDPIEKSAWYQAAMIRHGFIWLLNAFIVVYVLTRLLVYGEPVADKRSPSWNSFLATKKYASFAISAGNYKEAQRQLYDSLQILHRAVPHTGGFDELMSVIWQIIRHILNGLWIGRWFARMRRSASQPVPVVCKSHATTALVYHQLHQLHLIGVDGIDSGNLCGLNLALSAVNLAESAGISNDGITHKQRADIYINAALRVKLSLPKFLGTILFAYFLRRARRHVRKAINTEGGDLHSIQWIFHPLANKFFSDRELLKSVLQNGKQLTNFPFSNNYSSPKPLDRLICSFKMHLLTLLISKLQSTTSDGSVADFIEISHLLLNISTSDAPSKVVSEDSSMNEWDTVAAGQGDELCTWWTHLITCGLYWKYGDNTRSQKHYSLVRKCPAKLLNNDLALSAGLGFCTRKMCHDDKAKKDFADMAWVHTFKSYGHLKKSMLPHPGKTSTLAVALHKSMELITFEWLLVSLLDIWQSTLTDRPYWEQNAPSPMRRLYHDVFTRYRNIAGEEEANKIATFKLFGRVLNGANPLTTWQMLKKQNVDLQNKTPTKVPPSKNPDYLGDYHYNLEVFQRIQRDLSNMCNIRRT